MAKDNKLGDVKSKKLDLFKVKKYLKLYVLPLMGVGIFLGILVFLVAPKLSTVFQSLDLIAQDSQTIRDYNTELSSLQALSERSNLMQSQLSVIDETTPTGRTEVVAFRNKITTLIYNNSLVVNTQRLSEGSLTPSDVESPDGSSIGSLSLQELPFDFEILGSYDSIINFIKDLSTIDDFIIVKQMKLTSLQDLADTTLSGEWLLELKINKYQFNIVDEETLKQILQSIPLDAQPSQKVLDYVNSRID